MNADEPGTDDGPPSPGAAGRVPVEAGQPQPLKGARVLVAEDGKENQYLIAHYLSKAGATVTIAQNGRFAVDAVTAAASPAFDLVVMDMQMPEMDGYTATRVLRDGGHQLPIIALTAHAMSGDREKCLAAGCSDYATKPIDRFGLIAMCARLLKSKGVAKTPNA